GGRRALGEAEGLSALARGKRAFERAVLAPALQHALLHRREVRALVDRSVHVPHRHPPTSVQSASSVSSMRLLILPLLLYDGSAIRPTSLVSATCVPPSA